MKKTYCSFLCLLTVPLISLPAHATDFFCRGVGDDSVSLQLSCTSAMDDVSGQFLLNGRPMVQFYGTPKHTREGGQDVYQVSQDSTGGGAFLSLTDGAICADRPFAVTFELRSCAAALCQTPSKARLSCSAR